MSVCFWGTESVEFQQQSGPDFVKIHVRSRVKCVMMTGARGCVPPDSGPEDSSGGPDDGQDRRGGGRELRFPTTHWSCVAEAGGPDRPRAREALAELCDVYWYPLYAFIRRRGHAAEEALDLVQEYFARLLEKDVIAAADPGRGRFRTFLMADCSNFLSHQCVELGPEARRGARPSRSTPATPRAGS